MFEHGHDRHPLGTTSANLKSYFEGVTSEKRTPNKITVLGILPAASAGYMCGLKKWRFHEGNKLLTIDKSNVIVEPPLAAHTGYPFKNSGAFRNDDTRCRYSLLSNSSSQDAYGCNAWGDDPF
jgi:hypothetical protein